jgi:hypothetical protein
LLLVSVTTSVDKALVKNIALDALKKVVPAQTNVMSATAASNATLLSTPVWKLVTSVGAKVTVWLAETEWMLKVVMKIAKEDAQIALSVMLPENPASQSATSDGVRTTADLALRTLSPVPKPNGNNAVIDVWIVLSAMDTKWMKAKETEENTSLP